MMKKKRYLFYWLNMLVAYIFPLVYFIIRFAVSFKERLIVPLPIVLVCIILLIKISMDIPAWVKDWKPSFLKGFLQGLPIIFAFLVFISFGLILEGMIVELTEFTKSYWEVVLVLFGGMSVGTIFSALHLKYKELHLLEQGYTMGVINK